MRDGILAQLRKCTHDFFRQKMIDGRHSERRLPGAVGNDRQRSAAREMAWADEYYARRNFNAPVNFSGNAARIRVSGVWNKPGPGADFFPVAAVRKKRIDGRAEARRIIWIKPAGDSRKANHGEPGSSFRFGWLALDLECDIFAALIPDHPFVSVLVAAGIENVLHFVADRGGIREGMQFAHVGKAAHLKRLVQHMADF